MLSNHQRTVIRSLQLQDAARVTLRRPAWGRNLAQTLDVMVGRGEGPLSSFDATRLSLLRERRGVCTLVSLEGNRLRGLASGRRRSGDTVWELSHLLIVPGDLPAGAALLERLCQRVALSGGRRVFLRLDERDGLVGEARRSGFIRCAEELLYVGASSTVGREAHEGVREKLPRDEHDLFRLYNASTPAEVRAAQGMTFDQWRSSRERGRGSREFVAEGDKGLDAWLRAVQHRRSAVAELAVRAGRENRAGELLDFGLGLMNGVDNARFLLGRHQTDVQSLLSERGFEVQREFVTMASSMVATARETARRRAVNVVLT